MEFLSLENSQEQAVFLNLCHGKRELFDRWTHIGGITRVAKSKTDWYWVNSGNKAYFELQFHRGEPNNGGGNQMCLALDKQPNTFMYNDINCSGKFEEKFVCQEHIEEDPAIALTTPQYKQ